MSQELIYTSAPKGLKLGARGLCTVASTPGMAKNLADRLESLSGYRHLYPPGSPEAHLNPANFSYLRFVLGGQTYYLLSRIADAGLDYTQRTNKLAHHIVLHPSELPGAGPAWLASQTGFFETTWNRDPELLPVGRHAIPQGLLRADICTAWKTATGDAGWAGVLAERALKNASEEVYLVYRPGTDVLELFTEAQSLLLPEQRWAATFSTYFTKLPPGVECRWRGVVVGSPEALRAQRSPDKFVIDLTATKSNASGGELLAVARNGRQNVVGNEDIEFRNNRLAVAANSALDKRLPAGLDAVKEQTGGFVTPTASHPPALPQRQNLRWAPIPIGRGVSHRERAVWVSVIVILLASLSGLTYYFTRPVNELAVPAITSPGSNETKHPDGLASEKEVSPTTSKKDTGSAARPTTPTTTTNVAGVKKHSDKQPAEASSDQASPAPQLSHDEIPKKPPVATPIAKRDEPQSTSLKAKGVARIPLTWADMRFDKEFVPPIVSQLTNDQWKKPRTLASFLRKPELELVLVTSDRSSTGGVLSMAPSGPSGVWHILQNKGIGASEELATIGFNQEGSELQFRWAGDVDKAPYDVTDMVRAAALELRIPDEMKLKIIPFSLPERGTGPYRLAVDQLISDGRWTVPIPKDLWIPKDQVTTAYVQLSGVGSDSSATVTIVENHAAQLKLGVGSLVLGVKYGKAIDGHPTLGVSLQSSDDQTETPFPKWLTKKRAIRRQLLEDAIMAYNDVPTTKKIRDSYRKTLPKKITELHDAETAELKRINKLLQDKSEFEMATKKRERPIEPLPRYRDLQIDEREYGDLTKLSDKLKSLLGKAQLSVRITRRIRDDLELQVFVVE